MRRVILFMFVLPGMALVTACIADPNATPSFTAIDTTVTSRGVEIPVTFTAPNVADGKSFPLVVMAHGHGGSRNEGGGYRSVSESLALHGIASIRMDFPGCGDSTEPFTKNNLTNMLADLRASRKFADAQAGVDSRRVGLLGFSMGGRLVALLSEIDTGYKTMVAWAPAVANHAEREHFSLGGTPEAYFALRKKAEETGIAEYTTNYGQDMALGFGYFRDLENTRPLDAIAKFAGPLLIIYGDEDTAVPPAIPEAAIAAAANSSEVVRHVMPGVGHDLGFYSDRADVAAEVVKITVNFFEKRL